MLGGRRGSGEVELRGRRRCLGRRNSVGKWSRAAGDAEIPAMRAWLTTAREV
jgi:hypothetical protein